MEPLPDAATTEAAAALPPTLASSLEERREISAADRVEHLRDLLRDLEARFEC